MGLPDGKGTEREINTLSNFESRLDWAKSVAVLLGHAVRTGRLRPV